MFARVAFVSRLLSAGAVLALVFFAVGPARGQRLDDGKEALNKADKRDVGGLRLSELRKKLLKGETPADANDKDHREALDLGAKRVTYPYFWEEGLGTPGKVTAIFEGLESDLTSLGSPKNRPNTGVATQIYCGAVIAHAREVVLAAVKGGGQAITVINAARVLARLVERQPGQGDKEWADEVLPRLAGGNAEQLASALTELLTMPKLNDGVRYYALRGLNHLLAVPRQKPDLLKDGRDKAAGEVLGFLEALGKRKLPPSAPVAEQEGLKALRREAVRALARYPSPFLGEKDLPGLVLARIAGNDGRVTPPPRVDERYEAALGLARMRAEEARARDYNPDYAARQIGAAVVAFAQMANDERERKAAEKSRPWKVDAARLSDALAAMKAQVKNDYVAQVVDRSQRVLEAVEKGRVAEAGGLGDWLARNEPPSKGLHRGAADSTVDPRGAKKEVAE
jgi:hypothetical protein